MRKLVMLGCLAGVGCGGGTPTGPSTSDSVFTAELRAGNEVPPVTNAEAGATGTATVTFHVTRDIVGTLTGATVDFALAMESFPAHSIVRAAHIHAGAEGISGPILIDAGLSPSSVVAVPAAARLFSFTRVQVTAEDANAVLGNPSGHYFNVRTASNPAGVIRGQLRQLR